MCVDAHMGQVYWVESARCDGIVQLVSPERLGAPAEVVAPTERGWAAVGSGFSPDGPGPELATVLASAGPVLPSLQASAQDLFPAALRELAAGRTVEAGSALPVYLREDTAWRRTP